MPWHAAHVTTLLPDGCACSTGCGTKPHCDCCSMRVSSLPACVVEWLCPRDLFCTQAFGRRVAQSSCSGFLATHKRIKDSKETTQADILSLNHFERPQGSPNLDVCCSSCFVLLCLDVALCEFECFSHWPSGDQEVFAVGTGRPAGFAGNRAFRHPGSMWIRKAGIPRV